ncbi:hypothetical protein K488DRAFT_55711 [Vararia minispora EC-137]|uniref:Uncharacterized protein n=1 Tax=Vararia minispora EC-137 TaxID=1314806 RepID=A0ACB8QEK8_9AGAM|nr:hypothetical protein K488DRAFT_55711 [Vararia minispora EC-137]
MDGPGHSLSLKVMRVSRPTLATAWEPFYSSSPSFSAHSTASVLSLQGKTPLQGHPKTLRDLNNASEFLALPASFGAIQLGETFSAVLAVNNETAAAVDGVMLRVEMQTATSKVLLTELGGQVQSLVTGDTLEAAVHHEIKELGQHVLVCTVTYKLPPGSRQPVPLPEGEDPSVQTFKRVYKFTVTNPLSVKTKVHVPKSPAGMLSRDERDKVFLEVHIQNTTPEPMSFERIFLEPAPGWIVEDVNFGLGPSDSRELLLFGPMAMMQPQDARQYIYILKPVEPSEFFVQPVPGAVIPLGRLDLSWRSTFGEPGRLLTSMLSRRIPLVAPVQATAPRQQPASALPLHIQRSQIGISQPPSRPSTPPIATPTPIPYRPASPRVRPSSVPIISPSAITAPLLPISPSEALDVDLIATNTPRDPVPVDVPLHIKFSIGLSAAVAEGRQRIVSLIVQHVQLPCTIEPASVNAAASARHRPTHAEPGSTNSLQLARTPFTQPAILEPLVESPRAHTTTLVDLVKLLPLPMPAVGDEEKYTHVAGACFLGASVQLLPPFALVGHIPSFAEVELTWVPLRRGFVRIGGLRVIILDDHTVGEGFEGVGANGPARPPRILKEWDVVGEVWVS